MGKGINITKYKTINNIHYYYISKGNQKPIFYIGIDPRNQLLLFYSDEELSIQLGMIDFKKTQKILDIPTLNEIDVAMVMTRAHLAMNKGEFPEYIGFSS